MNTGAALGQLTQLYDSNFKALVPPVFTTPTTTDFIPSMKKLTSEDVMGKGASNSMLVPSLAATTIADTAASMTQKSMSIPKTDKEFTKLTLEQVYNNTIKTSVAIMNDISKIISEKDLSTGTEIRRRLLQAFLVKDRRMYVGIMLVIIAFVLYFIDSAA